MGKWTTKDIPNLDGKVAIVTGGNAGLGYQISLELARKNAKIIIACRTKSKGEKAIDNIEAALKRKIDADVIELDLTKMDSIRAFAAAYQQKYAQLDILINNAGVVNLIERIETSEGLEMHMATNHIGHFALTGLLYSTIINTHNARVVTMSSLAHRSGNIDFDDFNWKKRTYDRGKSYGDSKLANLMFVRSLQEKFNSDAPTALSVSAHPGLSATERQQTIGIGGGLSKLIAQPVWMGALPALRAATDPDVKPMDYYGPRYGLRGYPTLSKMHKRAFDKTVANRLWVLSEDITGVQF